MSLTKRKINVKTFAASRIFYCNLKGMNAFISEVRSMFRCDLDVEIAPFPELQMKWLPNVIHQQASREVHFIFKTASGKDVFETSPIIKNLYEQHAFGGVLKQKDEKLQTAQKNRVLDTFKS